jgi:uncharacterized membrane protein YbaN (DUF454 family)
MKKIVALLFGEDQDLRQIILMLIPPIAFVIYILLTYNIDYKSIVTALLAFDIYGGLLSNLQEKTHIAWSKKSKKDQWIFVILHLTLYPGAVILFQISIPLMMLMLAMLLSKTISFAIGNKLF